MPDRAVHRSLSRAVYADIRADILAGRYEPGAKLSPRAIATEHQVSLSVVREALTRLTEQDLVVAAPQLGFSVVELDIADVRDISRVRILIEGEGLREAIEHADVEYEARVVASHHRLSRTQYITGHAGETVTDARGPGPTRTTTWPCSAPARARGCGTWRPACATPPSCTGAGPGRSTCIRSPGMCPPSTVG